MSRWIAGAFVVGTIAALAWASWAPTAKADSYGAGNMGVMTIPRATASAMPACSGIPAATGNQVGEGTIYIASGAHTSGYPTKLCVCRATGVQADGGINQDLYDGGVNKLSPATDYYQWCSMTISESGRESDPKIPGNGMWLCTGGTSTVCP